MLLPVLLQYYITPFFSSYGTTGISLSTVHTPSVQTHSVYQCGLIDITLLFPCARPRNAFCMSLFRPLQGKRRQAESRSIHEHVKHLYCTYFHSMHTANVLKAMAVLCTGCTHEGTHQCCVHYAYSCSHTTDVLVFLP